MAVYLAKHLPKFGTFEYGFRAKIINTPVPLLFSLYYRHIVIAAIYINVYTYVRVIYRGRGLCRRHHRRRTHLDRGESPADVIITGAVVPADVSAIDIRIIYIKF